MAVVLCVAAVMDDPCCYTVLFLYLLMKTTVVGKTDPLSFRVAVLFFFNIKAESVSGFLLFARTPPPPTPPTPRS